MIRLPMFLLVLLLLKGKLVTAQLPVGDIQMYANFANDIKDIVNGDLDIDALFLGSTTLALNAISESIADISTQLAEFAAKNDQKMSVVMDTIISKISIQGKIDIVMHDLQDFMIRVDNLFAKFKYFSKDRTKYSKFTIGRFIKTLESDDRGDLSDILDRMYRLVIPGRTAAFGDSIFELVAKEIEVISQKFSS